MQSSHFTMALASCFAAVLGTSAGAVASVAESRSADFGLVAPGEVLMVGEVHGTKETPAAFVQLVDRMLTRADVVSVSLEMPPNAGAAACERDSGSGAVGAFWTRKAQDGRSSQAMREMVCQLKARAAQGKVRLLYLETVPRSQDEMVRRVSTEVASKTRPMVMLIGNFHSRKAPNSFAERLRAQGVPVTSLTTSSPDATTWNCSQDGCGARPMQMNFCPEETAGGYLLVKAPAGGRWDGCMVLPRLTSSPPFKPDRS